MRGRQPKSPDLRQRRNKASTRATLPSEAEAKHRRVPAMPKRDRGEWHANVKRWWKVIWQSPMAGEYTDADKEDLFQIVQLRQDFEDAQTASDRLKIAAEIRLQAQRFGFSPMDRRRLQWEIERGESAEDRTKSRRRERDSQKKRDEAGGDPRKLMRVEK